MAGRDYSIFLHTFWTGTTGRALRDAGGDAQRVAAYLITCGSSNMIGLYYLPLPLLCHELALTTQGASKALQRVNETGFGTFEGVEEVVFVPEMARIQIGETLSPRDNRHKAVIKLWQSMRKSKFYLDFHRRYAVAFNLPDPSPLQAPCKPLRSQEQEQEQEQEEEGSAAKPAVASPSKKPKTPTEQETIPGELNQPVFHDAWVRWKTHRKEIKKPLTPMATRQQLTELSGWGIDRAVVAINHTIARGWVGIREPDETNGQKPSNKPRPLSKEAAN